MIPFAGMRSCLPLVAHDPGQPKHSLRNEGDDHEDDYRNKDEWGRFTDDGHQGLLGHVGDDEEQETERRREKPDHDIDDNHNTEVDEVDAECLCRGNQDGNDDEENRGSLEQTPQDKQYRVDQEKIANRSQMERGDEVLYGERNVFDPDHVIED